ncbi:MAG: hypothetical protein N3G18_10370 [Candidatus Saccharicenans sp.]|nr:hypothetical protein [Candidatus Saccharicenans sp.]
MKKLTVLLSLFLIVGLVSLSYAQQKAATPPATQTKTFTGTISKVTPADPNKKTPAQIAAVGPDQKEITFHLGRNAVLTGADNKPITLDKLTSGTKVEIKYYASKGGVNIARSIKIVS